MAYMKTSDNDIFFEYDLAARTVRVISKTDIKNQIDALKVTLNALPEPVSNAEKIAWFDANYPQGSERAERQRIRNLIDQLQALLDILRDAAATA